MSEQEDAVARIRRGLREPELWTSRAQEADVRALLAAHEDTRDRLQTSEKMRGEANAREAKTATALAKEQQAHEETRRRLMDEEHEHALAMDQLREHELHGSVLVLRLALEQVRRELARVQYQWDCEKQHGIKVERELAEARDRIITLEADAGKRGSAWEKLDAIASLLSCQPGEVVERVREIREALRAALSQIGVHCSCAGAEDAMNEIVQRGYRLLKAPSRPASEPVEQPLHLITQRGQPYGSVRRCCERCGVAIPSINPRTSEHRWTDNENVWYADNANCRKPAPPASVAEQGLREDQALREAESRRESGEE